MVKENRPIRPKRAKKHLRMVTVYDPRTGEMVTQARRDADCTDPTARIEPIPPTFFPEKGSDLNHWALPADLRVARRNVHVAALRTWLESVEFTALCQSDSIVPLADLICAAADACSAAAAHWKIEQESFAVWMTGGEESNEPATGGLAAYAARKQERDLWRQKVRDFTGPLEPDREREIDALDDAELWQLLAQLDYATDCYRDAGGR